MHGIRIRNSGEGGYYLLVNVQFSNRDDVFSKQLFKLDSLGNIIWNVEVDSQEGATGHRWSDFSVSDDSSVYVIQHFIGCFDDGSILKLDRLGNIIFDTYQSGQTYPGSKLNAILNMKNGDQLIGGFISQGNECAVSQPYIARMRPDGTKRWETTFDTLYPGISVTALAEFSDSAFILNLSNSASIVVNDSGLIIPSNLPLGKFQPMNNGDYTVYDNNNLFHLDSNLVVQWQTSVGPGITVSGIVPDSAGNIYVSGTKDTCHGEMVIEKFNSSGSNEWIKIFGGGLHDAGEGISTDGVHVISIGTHSVHRWAVFESVSRSCLLYTTHTAEIRLIKMPVSVLTSGAILSSTGKYEMCPGDSITLSAPGGFNYVWNSGETSRTITVSGTGDHSVTITDLSGNDEILPAFYSFVYPLPALPFSADDTLTQCTGNFDYCMGVPYNDSIYDRDYKWYSSSGIVSNDPKNGNDYTGLPASVYHCEVSNMCGSDTSNSYYLLALPPDLILPDDTILCSVDSFLIAPVTHALNAGYTWQDSSHASYFLASDTTMNSSNVYQVTIEDQGGCEVSDSVRITFDNCTVIANPSLSEELSIYPNPTSGTVTISSDLVSGICVIQDYVGRKIRTLQFTGSAQADLSMLPEGTYFVQLISEGKIIRKKLLKLD